MGRYSLEGEPGLFDRSSAPNRIRHRTGSERIEVILALRRLRFTAAEIAELLEMALSTVSAILKRAGMGKLGRLGLEPAVRYEHHIPGGLIHVDVKKLGKIHPGAGRRFIGKSGHRRSAGRRRDAEGHDRNLVGWEYVHIAVVHPPGVCRGPRRRESHNRCCIP